MSTDQGSCLGRRYQLEALLGTGGFGTVYRAHDLVLDRRVAIKLLQPTAVGRNSLTRFLREARIVARLVHPNIVTLHDIELAERCPYLVMEYVSGSDLRRLTQGGRPLRLNDVYRIATQSLAALQYAHDQQVLHRDLKPENVLVTRDRTGIIGQTKLTDFGLATAIGLSSITRTGYVAGTTGYVAPERALGQQADSRADLYSFGVILYELIAGSPPFTADTPHGLLYQHVHEEPRSVRRYRPSVPEELDNLVRRLLAKDPAERPNSASEVLDSIESWQRGSEQIRPIERRYQPTPSVIGSNNSTGTRCKNCRALNPSKSSFCASCGTALETLPVADQSNLSVLHWTRSALQPRPSTQPASRDDSPTAIPEGITTVLARLAKPRGG